MNIYQSEDRTVTEIFDQLRKDLDNKDDIINSKINEIYRLKEELISPNHIEELNN